MRSQHGFCVARIGAGGKQVYGWSGLSCLGGHGPLASLVDHLLNLRPPYVWLLLGNWEWGQCGTSGEDISMGSGGSAGE